VTVLWIVLAVIAGFGLGFHRAMLWMDARRPRAPQRGAADLDLLLMLFQAERAKAVELHALTLVAHIDAVIGSLTRVRIGVVEGRSIDVEKELAAIVAADEQIVREAV